MQDKDLVASIPSSTKSKTWQDIERGEEHHTDTQQQYFQSEQPKSHDHQHKYSTRSKSREVNLAKTDDNGPTSFVYLRDDGEKTTPVWKQYEFILCNKLGEPRLDLERNPIVVIGLPPGEIVL